MLHPFDHVLFVFLAVALPLLGTWVWFPRLMRSPLDLLPRRKKRSYQRTMLLQWGVVLLLIGFWYLRGRSWPSLGLRFEATLFGLALPATLVALVAAGLFWQWRVILRSADARDKLRGQLERIGRLLPQRPAELRLFNALSVTAGVCEELLYRGFMLYYLDRFMPIAAAVVVASLIFGLGHSYQGPAGVLKTGALGLLFGVLYLMSGTLWHLMVIHAAIDIFSGRVGYFLLVEDGASPAPPADVMPEPSPAPLPTSTPT